MHNFDDLQKRCKKYAMKKKLKYALVAVSVIIAAVLLYLYALEQVSTLPEKKTSAKPKAVTSAHPVKKTAPKKEVQREKVKKTSKKVQTDAKKYSLQFLVASPRYINRIKKEKKHLETLGFVNCKLQQSSVYIHLVCNESDTLQDLDPYIKLAQRKKLDYVIRTQNNDALQQKQCQKKKRKKSSSAVANTKKCTKDSAPNDQSAKCWYTGASKRFAQTPNYAVALVIARNYYKEGNYKKAIVWAKKANQLNKSDAQSWIIYAKSLYALHQDAKARQLLHIYLQYENSDAAQSLLKQWEHTQ
ncbi:tetratricopeptide repeat protein [Sulfurimonas sp. NW9]|uniref:tetratricopeptide repeat protein n=1 Tax=Sulfurimonas sp. NW9 TaxID=2922728 RepID=UPI003DA9FD39